MGRATSRSTGFAIAVSLLLLARGAGASFIGVSDARRLSASCSGDPGGCYVPSQTRSPGAPFAPFNDSIQAPPLRATQNSTVSPSLLAGTGSISVHAVSGDYSSIQSLYDVTFNVDVATPYDLSGTITLSPGSFGSGVYSVTLYSGATVIYRFNSPELYGPDFDHSGLLDPGQYRLVAEVSVGGLITSHDAAFSFQMVPEPDSALLLGFGLALLARRRGSAPD